MPHHRSPASHDANIVSPVDVERALKGAKYPASKDELADYARTHRANPDVVGRILMLPGDRFASETEVLTAFSHSQSQGKHRGMA